jgi:hypothetical protein
MKLHTLLIVGFALSMTGCAEKEQAMPEAVDEVQAPPAIAAAPPGNSGSTLGKDRGMDERFVSEAYAPSRG